MRFFANTGNKEILRYYAPRFQYFSTSVKKITIVASGDANGI